MSESSPTERKYTDVFTCKAIVGLGGMALYIMLFILDHISAQVAIGFNVPIHNTSIYLEKLFGIRFLGFLLGVTLEYTTFRIYCNVTDTKDENRVRVVMNEISYGIMLLGRTILFLVTCFSSYPAYHAYFALAFESFGLGCTGGSIFGVVPQHATVILLSAHLSRFTTTLVQLVLDFFYRENALPKIKFQFFFCTILNATAIGCFYYYHHVSTCGDPDRPETLKPKENDSSSSANANNGGNGSSGPRFLDSNETFAKAFSPFFMFATGSFLFNTLFPGILPYAYLTRERCHMINMIMTFAAATGPIVIFCLETAGKFDKWDPRCNAAWLFVIPMTIIWVYALLAIHTRIPSARKIINNRPRVLAMTFFSALGHSFLDPLSFGGVAKVLFMSGEYIGDVGVLMAHQFFCMTNLFLHFKISVGYNLTRISLGYVFPKFRPTHRMSKWNTFWYVFRYTFRKAVRDAISDMTMNVKEYL